MSLDSVFEQLAPYQGQFFLKGRAVRHKTKPGGMGEKACPMCFLTQEKSGNDQITNGHFEDYMATLGLTKQELYDFMWAADGADSPCRKRILDTLGLTENGYVS